ncbi:unnamed protein product [Hymenolepis diminuta]|uniref:Uncharacterized protein n=1 Tax=Hymenolepis diminuta TaxID=6216 RepID=A0A0R3SJB6_HYMDI|nr:unnamed protein product [Hymenolepis diminuta]
MTNVHWGAKTSCKSHASNLTVVGKANPPLPPYSINASSSSDPAAISPLSSQFLSFAGRQRVALSSPLFPPSSSSFLYGAKRTVFITL